MPRPLQLAFFSLLAVAISSALWQHAHLPERVATHFNAAGHANGWLTRGAHTGLQIATLLFMAALFQGIVALNRRLPKELINIPNRDYWLAPERAAVSHASIAHAVLQMGCTVLAFLIALFVFIYRANSTSPPRLELHIWWAAGAMLLAFAAIVTRLVIRFARPPNT